MSAKDDRRADARIALEDAVREYFLACQNADYPFEDDLPDVVFDGTDGTFTVSMEAAAGK